ncbi:metal-dependent hydrolase [Croceicoccus mobilis]|uniref:Metal-dependent hydrolase n=1 Tax=Croceicoccus mobilis TaxID=1703339 RepID=A0A916YQE9_9SPHN|nr:metal-dependent hydrolase [Croceicoccus mobilis]GGD55040.1 hypothetical protein GCM10010990_00180 [Croceicoccus mobilis]
MDNLTHSLVGALLGQAGLKRRTGLAMPALIFGANLPDIDPGCVVWGTQSLAMRRGLTHGPIAWVLLPLALAGFLWWFDRWQTRRGTRPENRLPVRFGWLLALSLIGCLTHPALDWLNTYGVRFLEPFSHRWFHADVLFIIDIWLWAGMGLGMWLSLRRERRGQDWRRIGRISLSAVLAYIGVNAAITHAAETAANLEAPYAGDAIAVPVALKFWERPIINRTQDGQWIGTDWSGEEWGYGYRYPAGVRCRLPDRQAASRGRPDVAAFLFWSQTPFALQGAGGGTVIHDARFFDARTRGRFSVALPDIPCRLLE